jgi:signal peptidase II
MAGSCRAASGCSGITQTHYDVITVSSGAGGGSRADSALNLREPLIPLRLIAASAVIAFGFDRLSKVLIVHWLDLASVGIIEVQPPFLVLKMAWNKGINFGLFSVNDSQWVLVMAAVVISFALIVWGHNKSGWIRPLATGAIVGGALGNAFDRVFYGAVADFLNMSCCGFTNPSSFNVADAFIFFGAVFLIVGGRTASKPAFSNADKYK